jgi:hypothetical protein
VRGAINGAPAACGRRGAASGQRGRHRVGGAVRLVDGGRGEQCRSRHAWARTGVVGGKGTARMWPCGSPSTEAASGMRRAAVLSTSGAAGSAARGARGACAREGGGVARKPEAGRRGRVAFGRAARGKGRRERREEGEEERKERKREKGRKRKRERKGKEKGKENRRKIGKEEEKEKRGEKKKKRRGKKERGNSCRRFSRRPLRPVGHATATSRQRTWCEEKKMGQQ